MTFLHLPDQGSTVLRKPYQEPKLIKRDKLVLISGDDAPLSPVLAPT